MKNIKFYKTKITAFVLAGTLSATSMIGCSNNNVEESTEAQTVPAIVTVVDETNNKVDNLVPEINDEMARDTSIILLLDKIAAKDDNGKISADLISQLKSKVDSDNMISNFNSFLDIIQQKMISEEKVVNVSETISEDLEVNKKILSYLETILSNIIVYAKEENNDLALDEFNKLYSLFVEGNTMSIDGKEYKVSNLGHSSRAVANTYAEVATYYTRNYLSQEQIEIMDKVLNDQNNKANIKTNLDILSNQIDEKSEINVEEVFNAKYEEVSNLLNGKVNVSKDTVKSLVNYINIKYLNSDKVSTKDKNAILGEYSDLQVNDAIIAIDAISEYNLNNQDSIIPFSALLIDEYLKTDFGKTDKVALNFVQYNTIQTYNTKDFALTSNEPRNNPYFENLFKYFTKDNFKHVEDEVIWQEISDGVNFINDEVILYTLYKLPRETKNLDNYIEKSQINLIETIKSNQKTINSECEITDVKQFIKEK